MGCRRFGALALAFMLALTVGSAAYAGEAEKAKRGILDIGLDMDSPEFSFPDLGKYELIAFPTLNELLMALKSGRVAEAMIIEDCAAFLMKSDDSLTFRRIEVDFPFPLSMITREDDAELTAALNDAIAALKENGTLSALYKQYIDEATPSSIPEAPTAQAISGAQEVIVGVSGDFPPHDYVSAAGDPSGFNVALMNEIASLAGFNVRFETLTFGTKFAALESKRIDLFFLHMGYIPVDGIVQTEAYTEGIYSGVLTLK